MNIKTLEDLGLSNVEAKVYLALLDLGRVVANKVSEHSGIHRRTVYDALETLIQKGLVNFTIESNKKYYQAENPKRFLDLLENKKEEFNLLLPELLLKFQSSKIKQEINIYRGHKGLKNIFDDILKAKKEAYLFGSGGKFKESFGEIYRDQWFLKAKKNKIKIHAIFSEEAKTHAKNSSEIDSKFIKEKYAPLSSTVIYGNKTAIIIYSEQPMAILITSEEIASSYMQYFETLWKIAKK